MTAAPRNAVFLSYAREDTDAARRIADALRSQGVEVWFDQSELRGGDAWDAKIRTQIRTCALFVPIISAATQSRGEGYFRREWRLAVDRSHDMAEGVPFIIPLVIDATPESAALAPQEFMRVQWTRLPGALPTPQFVEHLKRVLEKTDQATSDASSALPTRTRAAPPRKLSPAFIVVAAVAVVAIGVAIFLGTRTPPTAPVAASTPPASKAAAPAPKLDDKSIAVLPFTNMSDEKDASAFFADGVHEDILTNLALIRELRVVSRTSVMQYRATAKPIRQIAQELGVGFVLEGSVRRVGNRVRVTGQLIRGTNDEHVWAQAYDRELTDIFAIQAALAQEIAGALKAVLSPQEQKLIERRPTENVAAYDAYLQGRDTRNRAPSGQRVSLQKSEDFFKRAVELDSRFAAAWGELAVVHALFAFWELDHSAARLAQGDAAIGQALRLEPDSPAVMRSVGTFAYYGYRDYDRAIEWYGKIARLQPNDPTVASSLGLILRRQGKWSESLPHTLKAAQLDPANVSYVRNLESTYRNGRRWDEAIAQQRRLVGLLPQRIEEQSLLARLSFDATGSTQEFEAWLARLSAAERESPRVLNIRRSIAWNTGDNAEAKRIDERQPYFDEDGNERALQALFAAGNLAALGDMEAAKRRLGNFPAEIRARLEREPANARNWMFLGLMEALLGHRDEALRLAQKAVSLLPESKDALDGPMLALMGAGVAAWCGDKERALAELRRLLASPNIIPPMEVRHSFWFAPLHSDPRFEALFKDPKNNAPLF